MVMFNLEVGAAPQAQQGNKDEEVNHNKLDDMIKELATTLKTVKHEQEYMQVQFINLVIKLFNVFAPLIELFIPICWPSLFRYLINICLMLYLLLFFHSTLLSTLMT